MGQGDIQYTRPEYSMYKGKGYMMYKRDGREDMESGDGKIVQCGQGLCLADR